jgi:hypothetical protein
MKNYIGISLLTLSIFSCSDDTENVNNQTNLCEYTRIEMDASSKFPLTPESATAVWNWKLSNDTLKVQTLNYLTDPDNSTVTYQTYFFKIENTCIEPIYCKQFILDDVNTEPTIYQADFQTTIDSYIENEHFKFRVDGFSNVTFNGSSVNYNQFFKSPNGNDKIWVDLTSHETDPVYGGYNWIAE